MNGAVRPAPADVAWLLVHSPMLGPASWATVAALLRAAGAPVSRPDLRPATQARRDVVETQARSAAESATDTAGRPVVVVGHSGAGPLLPAVVRALGPAYRAAVWVDAGLPHPGRSRLEALPPAAARELAELEQDGELPPWPQWFPPGTVSDLVPDAGVREPVLAECQPVPWQVFTEPMPADPGPVPASCAYLRLSAPYDSDARNARAAGWVVRLRDSHHLAAITDPDDLVADLWQLVGLIL